MAHNKNLETKRKTKKGVSFRPVSMNDIGKKEQQSGDVVSETVQRLMGHGSVLGYRCIRSLFI